MKQIPAIYWRENYEEEPSLLQRAWVQLWLELLDPNTGYPYAPPLITVIGLLDEWLNGQVKRLRTRFFLLEELYACFYKDPVLLSDPVTNAQKKTVLQLTQAARAVFDKNGCRKSEAVVTEALLRHHIADFENIAEALLVHLKQHYRESLCTTICDRLASDENGFSSFREVEILTRNLITALLSESQYSSSFLRARCVETFLRPEIASFLTRLGQFFALLLADETLSYTVYMRVQAKKVIEHVHQLGTIRFEASIPHIMKAIEQTSDAQGWNNLQEEHAKRFFYYGATPEQLVFAVADRVIAEDPDRAALLAMKRLDEALKQAKFEYEAQDFNTDKRIYVQDRQHLQMYFVSARKLRRERHGALGNPLRLERFMEWLELVHRNYIRRTDSESEVRHIAKKITTTALAWHRDALDADLAESQFINHWVSLEQIFEALSATVDCKKSTADKMVFALSEALEGQLEVQIIQDLWGDLLRLGVLGGRRLEAPRNGRVEYSNALHSMPVVGDAHPYIPHGDFSRPELYLRNDGTRLKFNLAPESVVLIRTGRIVDKGEWLAGPRLVSSTCTETIQTLYNDGDPPLVNLLYLACHQHVLTENNLFPEAVQEELSHWRTKHGLAQLIQALSWFDSLEQLLAHSDLREKGLPPYIVNVFFEELKDLEEKLVEKTGSKRPDPARAKLLQAVKLAPQMQPFYKLYVFLREQGYNLLSREQPLPDAVLLELFRNYPVDIETKINVFMEQGLPLKTDQALLQYRLQAIREYNWINPNFIAELDQMRRIRNTLFHEAQVPYHINLIANRLYKYARIYLREVTHKMAFNFGLEPEAILFKWD